MLHSDRLAVWKEHIRRNNEMGISASKYAKQHNIKLKHYYYWREKLMPLDRVDGQTSKLIPIVMTSAIKRRISFTIDSNGDLIVSGADHDQVALIVSTLLR